jgi:hypothetical protein
MPLLLALSWISTVGTSLAFADEARTVVDAESAFVTPVAPAPEPTPSPEPLPVVQKEESYPLNRAWLMETALGSTAFVLDQGKFQFAPLDARMVMMEGLLPASAWLHFGVLDSLTLGVGAGFDAGTESMGPGFNGWPVVAEVRFNFLNVGNWSFTAGAAGRLHLGFDGNGSGGRQSNSALLQVIASNVVSAKTRLHLSLLGGYGENQRQYTYMTSDWIYTPDNQGFREGPRYWRTTTNRDNSFRLRAGPQLEWRPGREHMFVFGGMFHMIFTNEVAAGYFYSEASRGELSTRAGIGYHFVSQGGVTIFLGGEIGPKFRFMNNTRYDRFPYVPSYGSGIGVDGGFSARLNFLL